MEMVEKPKKAPEQTAMVKMGMLGISPFTTVMIQLFTTTIIIFTTTIFTTINNAT